LAGCLRVSYEGAEFVKAAGGNADRLGGEWAVRGKSSREISAKVHGVVGDQEGATALIFEEGNTLESVARDIDAQLGPLWRYVAFGERAERVGDIIDVSKFYRAAYNGTLAANYTELQDFARDQNALAEATDFSDTPDVHINSVSVSAAAELQRTLKIASDADAPRFMQQQARGALAEGVGLTFMPLGIATRGKALARGVEITKGSDELVKVTSWADKGVTPDLNPGRWVVKGGASFLNYLKTVLAG
jgi:hypothetical protein